MFRPTNRQVPLLTPLDGLSQSQRLRLANTWSVGFREKVFPVLLEAEKEFAVLYADEGRPNWSVARLLGILVLQGMEDLPDQEAVDALSFDFRWQYALDLYSDEAYISRRSLVGFRGRLALHDPEGKLLRRVFDLVLVHALADLKLSVSAQRLDSTRIISNIAVRGRADLFGTTLLHFIAHLRKNKEVALGRLPPALRTWALEEAEGEFGWQSGEQARARLPELAKWLVQVRDLFKDEPDIRACEPYKLVERLILEQVDVLPCGDSSSGGAGESGTDGGGGSAPASGEPRVEVHPPASPSTAMQTPFDPDAGIGHKGVGYHVQIAETCRNESVELITDYEVHAAGVSDHGRAAASLDRLGERSLSPTSLALDAGYVGSESLADAQRREIELLGPVCKGVLPADAIGRDQWTHDPDTGRLSVCPQGHPVVRHGVRKNTNHVSAPHAYLDRAKCEACPVVEKCLARPPKNGKGTGRYSIEDTPLLELRDKRLREQAQASWRRRYNIRCGIEATNSELKRKHGLGRLRVRRAPPVHIAVATKLIGCNAKRWIRATTEG